MAHGNTRNQGRFTEARWTWISGSFGEHGTCQVDLLFDTLMDGRLSAMCVGDVVGGEGTFRIKDRLRKGGG